MLHPSGASRTKKGFTLLELAILVAILSFVAINFIVAKEDTQKLGADIKVTKNMKLIREKLRRHYEDKGYYPCPADPTLPITDANFGVSRSAGDGDCGTTFNLYRNAAHTVIMGAVPVRTLGLTTENMLDAQGNRIFFAVDEAFTNISLTCGSAPGILLLDSYDASDSLATNLTTYQYEEVPYVLMSMGPDGIGAYPYGPTGTVTRNTTQRANPNALEMINYGLTNNPATAGVDEEWDDTNRDNMTNMFIKPRLPLTDGTHYDDIITTYLDDLGTEELGGSTLSAPPPGYSFWLDAADISTIFSDAACTTQVTADADTIRCWKDKGPNSWDFTNTDADAFDRRLPTFRFERFGNCHNSVAFDSTGARHPYLRSDDTDFSEYVPMNMEWTTFLVVQGNHRKNDGGIYMMKGPYTAHWELWHANVDDGWRLRDYSDASAGSTIVEPDYPTKRSAKINGNPWPLQITATYTNTLRKFYGEGVPLYYGGHSYYDAYMGDTKYLDTAPWTGWRDEDWENEAWPVTLGGGDDNGTGNPTMGSNTDFLEVLFYPTALTPFARRDVECYLMDKWGVLPIGAEPSFNSGPANGIALWMSSFCTNKMTLDGTDVTSWHDWAPYGSHATVPGASSNMFSGVRNPPIYDNTKFVTGEYTDAGRGIGGIVFSGTQSLEVGANTTLDNFSINNVDTGISVQMIVDLSVANPGYLIGKSDAVAANREWEIYITQANATTYTLNVVVGGSAAGNRKTFNFPKNAGFGGKHFIGVDIVNGGGSKWVGAIIDSGWGENLVWREITVSTAASTSNPVTIGARPGADLSASLPFTGTFAGLMIENSEHNNDYYMGWYEGARFGLLLD